ncbi:MAG: PepSY domain-containing protein [Pseudomonadota bacterium]
MPQLTRLSTQIHKWVGLAVGIQVLFWVAGGLVMTVLPIERVRSEHHLAEAKPPPLALEVLLPADEAARRARVRPVEAQLRTTPRGPVWSFRTAGGGDPLIVAASTGAPLPPMTPDEARAAAVSAYVGEGRPLAVRLLDQAPAETGKSGPLWRVDFDDAEKTTFYLSPQSGEVVSRRSDVWRFYDFFWRLHIMDWKDGENFNHPLIIAAALLSLAIVATGFILLWIRLARDLAGWRRRRASAA